MAMSWEMRNLSKSLIPRRMLVLQAGCRGSSPSPPTKWLNILLILGDLSSVYARLAHKSKCHFVNTVNSVSLLPSDCMTKSSLYDQEVACAGTFWLSPRIFMQMAFEIVTMDVPLWWTVLNCHPPDCKRIREHNLSARQYLS